MIKFIKIGIIWSLFFLTYNGFSQVPGDCNNIKCPIITVRVIKGVAPPPPDTTTIVPSPFINLESGLYPFNTNIDFLSSTVQKNISTNNTTLITEYKWDYESDWNTGEQTKLKKSGTLSVRNRIGNKTSEIKTFKFNIYYNKVIIAGNSITQHGPYEPIGWTGDWGMAASAADKDYKSILENYLKINNPSLTTRVFPTARIEHDFLNYDFEQAEKDFGDSFRASDLVIIRLGENNKDWQIPGSTYKSVMIRYINMIKQHPNARVVITSTFWRDYPNTDAVLREIALENGYDWVSLEAIGNDSTNYAYGLFTNADVARHPNDKGMKAIADAIYEKVK